MPSVTVADSKRQRKLTGIAYVGSSVVLTSVSLLFFARFFGKALSNSDSCCVSSLIKPFSDGIASNFR